MGEVVQVFGNPRAGTRSARRVRALVRAFEELGAEVRLSESAAGIPAIDDRAAYVCVAGGDGTVRHVASAVARGLPCR